MGNYTSFYAESWDFVLEDLKRRRPDIIERMIDWYPSGQMEVTVKIDDGTKYAFHWKNDTIRVVRDPNNHCLDITESEWRQKFSRRLINKMQNCPLSQETLSKRTGISQQTISKYVNAKSTPSMYNLEKMAYALGCSILELTTVD